MNNDKLVWVFGLKDGVFNTDKCVGLITCICSRHYMEGTILQGRGGKGGKERRGKGGEEREGRGGEEREREQCNDTYMLAMLYTTPHPPHTHMINKVSRYCM